MYCLWLNGKRITDAGDIPSNYDSGALCGYFLGGSLGKWLRAVGANVLAERVDGIDANGDAEAQLAVIFGQTQPEEFIPQIAVNADNKRTEAGSSFASGSFSAGSFTLPGEKNIFGSFGSITVANATVGSFAFLGSFTFGSFNSFGSFGFGSFTAGSFSSGSFTQPDFTANGGYPLSSFHYKQKDAELSAQEKFRANLSSCPLNRFGYGIHLI